MNAHQSSYNLWTWIVAVILGLTLSLLLITGHGPTGACCSSSAISTVSTDDTSASAIATPIPDHFSFKVTANDFTNEGDGLTVPWFNNAEQLKAMLADGDDWMIYGDDKAVTLIGTVKSESLMQQKLQEAQSFFGPEVNINNEMVVTTSEPLANMTPPEIAKIYFAVGKENLPANSEETLSPIITWLKTHNASKAIISGYHDATGSFEKNQQLAKARAQATYDALVASEIEPARIVMRKPQQTTGSGDLAEARRVEVSIE